MRVSQKAEYALRAILELTLRSDPSQPVRSSEIARNQQIPEKFLEMILVELRRAGLIISQRGPVGGHRLARRPEEISVGAVWRAIDGAPERQEPTARRGRGGDPFRRVFAEVDRVVAGVVDKVSLADIRREAEVGRNVPDFSI